MTTRVRAACLGSQMCARSAIMLRQITFSTSKSVTCSVQPALSLSTLPANSAARSVRLASTQVVPPAQAAMVNHRTHTLTERIAQTDATIGSSEMLSPIDVSSAHTHAMGALRLRISAPHVARRT